MINFYKQHIIWEYRFFLKVFRKHIKKPEKLEDKMQAILFFWKIAKIKKYYRIYNFRCNRRNRKKRQKEFNLVYYKILKRVKKIEKNQGSNGVFPPPVPKPDQSKCI